MLATIFVVQGYKGLRDPKPLVPAAEKFAEKVGPMIEKNAPAALAKPQALVRLNAGAQIVGGAALATGNFPRLASLVLAGTLVPATWMGHPFWEDDDPVKRNADSIQAMKNLGLAGGLLLSATDRKRRRKRKAKRGKEKTHSGHDGS
jgi:uncharacterized membrane protein YphA (DoxX/SURF4 family)